MHIFQPLVRSFSILCFLAVLYSVSLQASSIIDLGTLGGDEAIANDINNKGQIVGRAKTAAGIFHPFLYSGGQMTDLLPGEPRDGFAEGINDAGQIAGSIPTNRTGTSSYDPALYTGGKWVDISISGGGGAHAINDAGEIVGGDRHGRPFLYSRGQVTYFAGGYGGTATAINNRGQIVGSSDFGGSFPDGHAFLYTAGQLMDLGTPFTIRQ